MEDHIKLPLGNRLYIRELVTKVASRGHSAQTQIDEDSHDLIVTLRAYGAQISEIKLPLMYEPAAFSIACMTASRLVAGHVFPEGPLRAEAESTLRGAYRELYEPYVRVLQSLPLYEYLKVKYLDNQGNIVTFVRTRVRAT